MIGKVKIEFGFINLYINGVWVISASTMAEIRDALKKYNLQGYIMGAD